LIYFGIIVSEGPESDC